MTIKSFCDYCGKEIERNYVSERLDVILHCNTQNEKSVADSAYIRCEVTVGVNGTWNKGEICKECVLKVLTEGKDTKGIKEPTNPLGIEKVSQVLYKS